MAEITKLLLNLYVFLFPFRLKLEVIRQLVEVYYYKWH
ncbi:MAG: hypothetical protein RLY16_2507 [Bacteroidota bacterium]